MKLKNNTITFERNDSIFFDGKIISDGSFAVNLNEIFCFKFKFPDDKLTAAFVNKDKFTYQNKQIAIGASCAWLPNLDAAFSCYDLNKYLSSETTDMTWKGIRLLCNYPTEKHVWLDDKYAQLLPGWEVVMQDEDSPVYGLVGGKPAICVMPVRITKDLAENKMLAAMVSAMCKNLPAK